jgi:hypothetical protein
MGPVPRHYVSHLKHSVGLHDVLRGGRNYGAVQEFPALTVPMGSSQPQQTTASGFCHGVQIPVTF